VSGRVSFGEFVLDLDARELVRNGEPVLLSPKAFELLGVLVQSRPTALSKADLQERLWPDTFVVEKNLTNLVAEIRQALGDKPNRAQFVRTVHRFGYAFRASATKRAAGESTVGEEARFRLEWIGGRAILHEGEYVLGRDPQVDVFLESPSVSRRHALIRISAGQATLEDLDSKNGTFIDDVAVHAVTPLDGRETIRLGSLALTIKQLPALRSTRTGSSVENVTRQPRR
jgi:DNA-binding winged helix-turn-helix (wHTH) protein